MSSSFPRLAFTDSVKEQQSRYGSRAHYERVEAARVQDSLSAAESDFISQRDGFYLASVSGDGQPYVQFRGGPRGFLKTIDPHTLAYADFRGNRQYVSMGNFGENNRAALILMDYPNRRRLKILATMERRDAAEVPELVAELREPGYPALIERVMLVHVQGFDWNCPQHITPRYSREEMQGLTAPLHARIEELEEKVRRLTELQPAGR